jgi:GGDEF domain-containing protein
VLPACARAEAARMVGQRLREALEAAGVTTPFSFGVAECPPGAEVSARDLIDAADRDMLAHKEPKPPERSGRPGAPGPRIERA